MRAAKPLIGQQAAYLLIAGNQPRQVTHRSPDPVDHAIMLQLAEQRCDIQRMILFKGQLNRHACRLLSSPTARPRTRPNAATAAIDSYSLIGSRTSMDPRRPRQHTDHPDLRAPARDRHGAKSRPERRISRRAPIAHRGWLAGRRRTRAGARELDVQREASFAGQLFRLHRQSAGVLRLAVPGRLAPRPLRGLLYAGPLEQRAPGPESTRAAASAITAASAPAGPAGSGRKLSRLPRRAGNDRRICPTPAAASRRCPRLSAFQAPMASCTRGSTSESSRSVFARG